jgi:hypothetical protein
MGLIDSSISKRRGAEKEISTHVFCECEVFATLRHNYLNSFFLDREDDRRPSLGAILNFIKESWLL